MMLLLFCVLSLLIRFGDNECCCDAFWGMLLCCLIIVGAVDQSEHHVIIRFRLAKGSGLVVTVLTPLASLAMVTDTSIHWRRLQW
jgi:uncharacterized membrane protein YhaH (DUF805 family)